MNGPIVVGMRAVHRRLIESSCVECSESVQVPYGHGIDAKIICDGCAARSIDDADVSDYEDTIEVLSARLARETCFYVRISPRVFVIVKAVNGSNAEEMTFGRVVARRTTENAIVSAMQALQEKPK
jgi:hypothetical protein